MCIILKLNAKRITALLVFACHCHRDLSYAYYNDQHPYFAPNPHTRYLITFLETSTQDETPPIPSRMQIPRDIRSTHQDHYITAHTHHTNTSLTQTTHPSNPSYQHSPSAKSFRLTCPIPCSNNHLTSPLRNPYVTPGHRACFRSDYAVQLHITSLASTV